MYHRKNPTQNSIFHLCPKNSSARKHRDVQERTFTSFAIELCMLEHNAECMLHCISSLRFLWRRFLTSYNYGANTARSSCSSYIIVHVSECLTVRRKNMPRFIDTRIHSAHKQTHSIQTSLYLSGNLFSTSTYALWKTHSKKRQPRRRQRRIKYVTINLFGSENLTYLMQMILCGGGGITR